jgi:hypothetical protein
LTVSDSSRKEATQRAIPKPIAAMGEIRPEATGRLAVRAIVRSMSRSTAWLIAPAPPAERAPPRQVRRISSSEGLPATYIVVTVVNSSNDCTFGLVSVR